MLLEVKNLDVGYQKVPAVKGVSLSLARDQIVTLVGANGAGKSTILRTISGLKKASGGEIWFDNHRIDQVSPDKLVAAGIAHVPEGRRVFPELTVQENLYIGAYSHKVTEQITLILDEIYEYFPVLKERRSQYAKTLSGGEQQMLAMGRALMSRPRMLLMDEPSLGLAPIMINKIAEIIRIVHADGIPVILVEQNAELALNIADYAYVLETGSVVLEGEASELHDNEHVRKAYLGA